MLSTYGALEGIVIGVLIPGALVEAALTVLSVWVPDASGGYGAPFEAGNCGACVVSVELRPSTFDWLVFALDIAVAATLFLLVLRWSGWLGVVLGTTGALASLALAVAMALSGLPVADLPIPLFRDNPLSPSLVLWLDMFSWAGAIAWLVRWRRQRNAAARSGMR